MTTSTTAATTAMTQPPSSTTQPPPMLSTVADSFTLHVIGPLAPATFAGAAGRCRQFGGTLARIGSFEIRTYLQLAAELSRITKPAWVGLRVRSGRATWTDGCDFVTPSLWAAGEPNFEAGSCGAFAVDQGTISLEDCLMPRPFFCQLAALAPCAASASTTTAPTTTTPPPIERCNSAWRTPYGLPGRQFLGEAIAADRDRIYALASGTASSAIAMYTRDLASGWVQEPVLLRTDRSNQVRAVIAAHAGSVAVGFPSFNQSRGDVLVWNAQNSSAIFTQLAPDATTTTTSGASNMLYFGASIALSDQVLVVGAPGQGARGVAYVYQNTTAADDGYAPQWTKVAVLSDTLSDSWSLDRSRRFGFRVAAVDDYIVVSSPEAKQQGLVFIFALFEGVWSNVQYLRSPFAKATNFGNTLALSSKVLVVGTKSFYVFVYVRANTGLWEFQTQLVPSNMQAVAFGAAIAVSPSGTKIVVSAAEEGAGASPGQVFAYSRSQTGQWLSEPGSLRLPQNLSTSGDGFGTALAFDAQEAVIVGAPGRKLGNFGAISFFCGIFVAVAAGDTDSGNSSLPFVVGLGACAAVLFLATLLVLYLSLQRRCKRPQSPRSDSTLHLNACFEDSLEAVGSLPMHSDFSPPSQRRVPDAAMEFDIYDLPEIEVDDLPGLPSLYKGPDIEAIGESHA
eukprot:m.26127 g.26127  ORF g.26127 m.26127 type:complete len:678 (-) comp4545_c0_seq1:254-2287(-)